MSIQTKNWMRILVLASNPDLAGNYSEGNGQMVYKNWRSMPIIVTPVQRFEKIIVSAGWTEFLR